MDEYMSEEERLSLRKFESMMQSNKVYFFDSEEFEEIVYHYMDVGKMNLANKAIDLSLSQHPTSIPLKLIKVELLVFENKLKLAEKLLTAIESVDPTFDEIYIQRASILSKSDDHKGAIKQLYKALELTNDLVDVHALLGMEFLFIEDFTKAISHFSECLTIDIEDYAALYNIIYCYDMLDENEKAIQFLTSYIDENPYSEIAWHQLGRQYIALKKYTDAIRAFDYAVLIDELFIGAYLEKGKALEAIHKYEEAISNYMITLKLDDPTAFTYLQIAGCYQHLEEHKLAIKYYHKAVDEDPLLDQAWLMITNLYMETDSLQKALHYIQKALEVDNDNTDFLNRFAEINIRLNLFEEASVAFKKSISLGDKRLVIYLALADILHFIGEFNEVNEVLLDTLKLFPESAEVHYRLAGIYFILRKETDAILFLEKGLKLNFSYQSIAEHIYPEMFLREDVKHLITKFSS